MAAPENGSQQTQPTRSDQQTTDHPVQLANFPEHLMSKNRLQEYTQKSALPLPVYQTTNEGAQHAPRFRAVVVVDGSYYVSSTTYPHLKAAEQDAARVALDGIAKKIKDEGCHFIREDTTFCKSILNEYAVKINMEIPTYTTIRQEGKLPVFVSCLFFNGVDYTGNAGKTKKEAEQLVARAAILSILGDSCNGSIMSKIVKTKLRLCAALNEVNDSPTSTFGAHPPLHEFKKPRLNPTSEPIVPPIAFVPSSQPPLLVGSTSRRKQNRNKKAKKKAQVDDKMPVAAVPLSQLPPCSVAQ